MLIYLSQTSQERDQPKIENHSNLIEPFQPLGCWDGPPAALGNMTFSWNVSNTDVGFEANYT